MGSGGPPGAGLGAAGAAAAAGPGGPPGAAPCGWEVYVTTHSQHRFWPGKSFDHQLCAVNGDQLGAAQQSQAVNMTTPDSPPSKFTGSGAKKFGVTNTAHKIANEEGWVLVRGATSDKPLANKHVPLRVADGKGPASVYNIDLHLRHPLLMYGHLR